ncbi:MAG: hypothetical protein CSH37_01770, partial [Thalassolituus sp.]
MSQHTKKHTENAFDYFRKHALSVAISAFSTTLAGIRDGLQRGVYVALIAGQVVAPVVWAGPLPDLAGDNDWVTLNEDALIAGIDSDKSAVYDVSGNRVLANWTSFDIDDEYGVEFIQASPGSILVNQIAGSASKIAGLLKANGNIILVNPNGMTIAGTATIDVNSLVVSGMGLVGGVDAADQAFFNSGTEAENYNNLLLVKTDANGKITIESGVKFTVDAEGTAHTRNNKFIAIGAEVENSADIVVGNLIGLGAGGAGFVSFDQDGLVGFEISSDVVSENALKSLGDLTATNGTVLLSANASNATINSALNIEGTVQATAINIDADKITLGKLAADDENTVAITASESLSLADLAKVTIEDNATYTINASSVTLSEGFNEITTSTSKAGKIVANGDISGASETSTESGLSINLVSSVQLENGDISTDSGVNLVANETSGIDNKLVTNGISFSGVSSADLNGNDLSGSSKSDTFDVTGGTLTANNIDVTNSTNTINAGGGNDIFSGSTDGWTVVANGQIQAGTPSDTSTIFSFTDVTAAAITDQALKGQDSVADTYTVTQNDTTTSVTTNGIVFTEMSEVLAGNGTAVDSVVTDGLNIELNGAANELKVSDSG